LKHQQLNGQFFRAFGTHPGSFANDVITEVQPRHQNEAKRGCTGTYVSSESFEELSIQFVGVSRIISSINKDVSSQHLRRNRKNLC